MSGEFERQFASDNYSGICPEVWEALAEANSGHAPGYGNDPWTEKAKAAIADLFETECDVFFVFNGTAANSLSLAALCQPFHSVICHRYSHLDNDECGAPGFFAHGIKLQAVDGRDGKLAAADIAAAALYRTDVHAHRAGAVSIANATEVGTVYRPSELGSIGEIAREHSLGFHVDGARFANAVAGTGASPKQLTWEAGVDVLSFGGTKNGLALGEAVVIFNKKVAEHFDYRVKQAGQLGSKMRFLSAQWLGILRNDAWLRHARHANEVAGLLGRKLSEITEEKLEFPREANAVFARLPEAVIAKLHESGRRFYLDVGPGGIARFMCSWDTSEGDVMEFASQIASLIGNK